MNDRFNRLDKHFINMSQQQTNKMLPIYNSITECFISHDYKKSVPLLTIVIPVNGRMNHLAQSVTCLVEQTRSLKNVDVQIVVSEMNTLPQHKDFCKKMNVGYIHTACSMFSKSIAMNQAARLLLSETFIFYDVDLVTDDAWLQTCVQFIQDQYAAGSRCWISQPIPGRRIYYVNDKNTSDILFWDYSPEDLSLLKNACSLSDTGKLLSWDKDLTDCNVYHLYHPPAQSDNMAYEHMVFADSIMDGLDMRAYYLHEKLKYGIFNSWSKASPDRFPGHIFLEVQRAFRSASNLDDFKSNVDVLIRAKCNVKDHNSAMFRSYEALAKYLKSNPELFESYHF